VRCSEQLGERGQTEIDSEPSPNTDDFRTQSGWPDNAHDEVFVSGAKNIGVRACVAKTNSGEALEKAVEGPVMGEDCVLNEQTTLVRFGAASLVQ
jgi:hypothetical protein